MLPSLFGVVCRRTIISSPVYVINPWRDGGLVFTKIELFFRRAGMFDGPFLGNEGKLLGLLHEHACNFGVLRIFGVGNFEKHADREEGRFYGLNGRPAGSEGV